MNTNKHYEFKLSLTQVLLSICALIGCFFFAFTLGAFMGSRFLQGFSAPAAPPPRQNLVTSPPVSDYNSFEPLNTPADESGKTVSQLTFYDTLGQNVEMPPSGIKDPAKAKALQVTPPTRDSTPDKPLATPLSKVFYTIQIGAFLQKEKAATLADKLTRQGYPAQVVSKSNGRGETWHRVRVGSYTTKEEAKHLFSQLSELSYQPQITPAE